MDLMTDRKRSLPGYWEIFTSIYEFFGGVDGRINYAERECMADQIYATLLGLV